MLTLADMSTEKKPLSAFRETFTADSHFSKLEIKKHCIGFE